MENKDRKYAEFYIECEKYGYIDMTDPAQNIKAKVLAKDMGLDYQDINLTFLYASEAKKRVDKADQIAEERRIEEERKEREKAERLAKTGELLLTVNNIYKVYRRKDNSFYYTKNDDAKIEGVPIFALKNSSIISSTFHPSQTVYTGATVGGVSTGGFHETKAYTTERAFGTGNGYISMTVDCDSDSVTIKNVRLSQFILERFKRDKRVNECSDHGNDYGRIICQKEMDYSWRRIVADNYLNTDIVTQAFDSTCLPLGQCQKIFSLIQDIVNGKWPDTDDIIIKKVIADLDGEKENRNRALSVLQETTDLAISDEDKDLLYTKSVALCGSDSHLEIDIGTRLLTWLLWHTHLNDTEKEKYRELLQESKERGIVLEEEYQAAKKIREKENRTKSIKRTVIAMCILAVLVLSVLLVVKVVIPESKYKEAQALLDADKYMEATDAFKALGNYKDSENKVYEILCVKVEDLLAIGKYDNAVNTFKNAKLKESTQMWQRASDAIYEKGLDLIDAKQYKDAYVLLNGCGKNDVDLIVYSKAEELVNSKQYEDAYDLLATVVTIDGKYEDLKKSCAKAMAKEFEEKGDDQSMLIAIDWYDKADEANKADELRYNYFQNHYNSIDESVLSCLRIAKEHNYKDSAALYEEMYGVKAEIIIYSCPIAKKDDIPAVTETDISLEYGKTENQYIYLAVRLLNWDPGISSYEVTCEWPYQEYTIKQTGYASFRVEPNNEYQTYQLTTANKLAFQRTVFTVAINGVVMTEKQVYVSYHF